MGIFYSKPSSPESRAHRHALKKLWGLDPHFPGYSPPEKVSAEYEKETGQKAQWKAKRYGRAFRFVPLGETAAWIESKVRPVMEKELIARGALAPRATPVVRTQVISEQAQAAGQAERRRLLRGRRGRLRTRYTAPGFMTPIEIKRRYLKARLG